MDGDDTLVWGASRNSDRWAAADVAESDVRSGRDVGEVICAAVSEVAAQLSLSLRSSTRQLNL